MHFLNSCTIGIGCDGRQNNMLMDGHRKASITFENMNFAIKFYCMFVFIRFKAETVISLTGWKITYFFIDEKLWMSELKKILFYCHENEHVAPFTNSYIAGVIVFPCTIQVAPPAGIIKPNPTVDFHQILRICLPLPVLL